LGEIIHLLKNIFAKVLFIILCSAFFVACEAVKRVPDGKFLLVENKIKVDNHEINEEDVNAIPLQQPNIKFFKKPLALYIYNLAKPNADSIFYEKFIKDTLKFKKLSKILSEKQVYRLGESFWYKGRHNFFKKIGEAPVIVDANRTKRSLERLQQYYHNKGYFNNYGTFSIDSIAKKKATINFDLTLGHQYKIDSLKNQIKSIQLDSIYKNIQEESYIKSGENYTAENFDKERNRLTNYFRNNGVYNFQKNYITFQIDTINTNKKANIKLQINNFQKRQGDSLKSYDFKVSKIKKIHVYLNPKDEITDSIKHNGIDIFSRGKMKYMPKAITNTIFLKLDQIYSDEKISQTNQVLNNLKMFNYPIINIEEAKDSTGVIANIYLQSKERYGFGYANDIIHNNIQQVGLIANTSFSIRNIFKRAETLEFGLRANIGSSRDIVTEEDKFFNIFEIGADMRLSFPRIVLPFKTDKFIPYDMLPTTNLNIGLTKQTNIGLDKENLTANFNYSWQPNKRSDFSFDLFSIQYINNLNINNYFNVYRSSFNQLNSIANRYYDFSEPFRGPDGFLTIPKGADDFIFAALFNSEVSVADIKSIIRIWERKNRLTQNNLILSSAIAYSKNTRKSNNDNTFSVFKVRLETAGNGLSLFAKKEEPSKEGEIFNVAYSQYVKTDIEFTKQWDLKKSNVFAVRGFVGFAKPFGNSTYIPFIKSYFAGGSNDIRAWRPYSLGPGRSIGILDFNEANFKITCNAEYRFNIYRSFKGALFADAGNIWHLMDDLSEDEEIGFKGLSSLRDVALATGFGIRYDLTMFVIRVDLGFKTYNPALPIEDRWFTDFKIGKSILNIGVNYPF
jgi:outer membrane protein assembly factor BamA